MKSRKIKPHLKYILCLKKIRMTISGLLSRVWQGLCSGLSPHIPWLQTAEVKKQERIVRTWQKNSSSVAIVEGMDGLVTGTGASEAKSCLLLENSQQFSRQASPCLWTHGWVPISSRATKGEIFQFLIILQYLAFCELHFQDFCTTLVPKTNKGD